MEKIWLLIACGALIYAIYLLIKFGFGMYTQAFVLISVIAFAYYLMRRFMRRRMEKLVEFKTEEMRNKKRTPSDQE